MQQAEYDVLQLVKQVGGLVVKDYVELTYKEIEAFAKLVMERERERIANKVDGLGDGDPVYTWWVAEQIRAEGDKQ